MTNTYLCLVIIDVGGRELRAGVAREILNSLTWLYHANDPNTFSVSTDLKLNYD